MAYPIVVPILGQPASASLFGKAVKDAIDDLDARISALEAFTVGKPVCRVVANATQGFADNTDVAAVWSAPDSIDTHGMHDPAVNNTRFTPNVAGIYRMRGIMFLAGATTFTFKRAWWRKNGSTGIASGESQGNMVNSVLSTVGATAEDVFNGTSDYMEFMIIQDNTANAVINSTQSGQYSASAFIEFIRGTP